jgi:hypothetical protein
MIDVIKSPDRSNYQEREMDIDWITTRDAAVILNVTSTQGVWNVIERARRYHQLTVRLRNIGSDKKPRYMLAKDDVETVAKAMGKL